MELMKRLTEINGFICESRGRLEELKSDCQNWALDEDGEIAYLKLDAQAEVLRDWLTRLELVESEIDDFTKEWRKREESKIQIKSSTHDELFNIGSSFPDPH